MQDTRKTLGIAALVFSIFIMGRAFGQLSHGSASDAELKRLPVAAIGSQNLYRGYYAPSGSTLYFFRQIEEAGESYRIFTTTKKDGMWQPARRLDLGGEHSDLYPAVSPDGSRLVFSSYRPVPGEAEPSKNANLWIANNIGGGWSAPRLLEHLSTPDQYDSAPRFEESGSLWFETTSPDWETTTTLVARWNGQAFERPIPHAPIESVKKSLPKGLHVWNGIADPSGLHIILEVSRRGSNNRLGPSDLWAMSRTEESWSEPKPLGSGINTAGTENFVHFSPDGKRMGFVRDFKEMWEVSFSDALDSTESTPRVGVHKTEITFLANEGFLIKKDGISILIDGFVKDAFYGYGALPDQDYRNLIAGNPPFDQIRFALTTHVHLDHFQVMPAIEFLENNKHCVLFSTEQVISQTRHATDDAEIQKRLKVAWPDEDKSTTLQREGLSIETFRLRHANPRNYRIQNLGVLIHFDGTTILHVGDAEARDANFEHYELAKKQIDIAILPDWLLGDQELLDKHIAAKQYIAAHIPAADLKKTRAQLINSNRNIYVFDEFMKKHVFEIE